jgi:hypothetical protein
VRSRCNNVSGMHRYGCWSPVLVISTAPPNLYTESDIFMLKSYLVYTPTDKDLKNFLFFFVLHVHLMNCEVKQ